MLDRQGGEVRVGGQIPDGACRLEKTEQNVRVAVSGMNEHGPAGA